MGDGEQGRAVGTHPKELQPLVPGKQARGCGDEAAHGHRPTQGSNGHCMNWGRCHAHHHAAQLQQPCVCA